jgi:hypothetical protein
MVWCVAKQTNATRDDDQLSQEVGVWGHLQKIVKVKDTLFLKALAKFDSFETS